MTGAPGGRPGWRAFAGFVRKEGYHILRDWQTLLVLLGLPLLQVLLFGFAIRSDVRQVPLAFVEPVPDAVEGDRVEVVFQPPAVSGSTDAAVHDARDPWEHGRHVKEEEFSRAVSLGLFDYMRKSRSRGFVVSASGGADSSAVACLVAIAVRLACGELSPRAAAARMGLPSVPGDSPAASRSPPTGPSPSRIPATTASAASAPPGSSPRSPVPQRVASSTARGRTPASSFPSA